MPQSKQAGELRVIPIPFADEIRAGDSVSDKLLTALKRLRIRLKQGDILVVKHKIISKSEGQFVALEGIRPSKQSIAWAQRYKLDARVIEIALAQSNSVIRKGEKNGVLITETHHGLICANSGVDVSNVDGGEHALLLPKEPDRAAAKIHRAFKTHLRLHVPVMITDTFGRPWREGLTEVAIGIAGMKATHDYRGRKDSHGYPLRVSIEAVADEIACAAGLVCGKLERVPACIIRGFPYQRGKGSGRDLIRPAASDLFR
jgi:coenzyme F420-0:L-glutamate ligase / coenzyme F420-1:gamma-L-glutamate ligase